MSQTEAELDRARQTGICPRCSQPMMRSGKSSICSSPGCSLGVIPKCKTYAPASKKFTRESKKKTAARWPIATRKTKTSTEWIIQGLSGYFLLEKRISLTAAKKLAAKKEKQLRIPGTEDLDKQEANNKLQDGEAIARYKETSVAIFRRSENDSD